MKIDITSMFFNSKIEGQTATAAWATSIGQNKTKACRIDDFKQDVVDMVIGMTYKCVSDHSKLDVSKGSPDREVLICSVFDNIYVNGLKVPDSRFTLLLVREHSQSHEGRLLISYAPYISYDNIANQDCINLMASALGCTSDGCWFVYDIDIKNQSDLHFSAVVVNPNSPMIYSNSIKSKDRSKEWKDLIPVEDDCFKRQWQDGLTYQVIFYGAPGTGKSHKIKNLIKDYNIDEKIQVFRTTFHPDSDYSTFVGAYKPTMKKLPIYNSQNGDKIGEEEKIAYSFVAQSFLKAYVTAWQNREQAVCLVIEEINRGNCAQIFGDLFQLLDRNEEGVSEYPIKADQDMQDYLKEKFADCVGLPENIKSGDELQLPSNLYIWATMNTSDQSLFPIDSAFKRRWDWEYMPIAKGVDKDGNEMNWSIVIGEKSYDWWDFLTAINEVIGTETQSEDKKLGFFFCKADANDEISADKFVNKVLFYLWNDVFKTCGVEYHYKDGDAEKLLTFDKFHTKDGFDVKKIQDWLEQDLKLDVISIKETREEEEIVGDVKKLTEYQRLRKEYWTKFLNYAREESSAKDDYNRYFSGRKTPSTDKWYNFYFGAKDCHLVVEQTRSSNELYMGLYFDKTTDDFYKLVNSKEAIERELGISFKWNELPDKKSSYICEVTANVDFNDSTDYKRQFDFIIDRLLRMREVFSKYLG